MPDVASLSVSINADTSGLDRGLADAERKVSGFGSALQSAMGAAAVGAVAGLGAAFAGSVKSAADFEKQMSAVGAVAGASASEMQQLTQTALQLGKDTSFSAKEAAQGVEELVKAGVSIADVIGGGARAALDLAAAGAISVGEAAEIASNAMNVFNLKGADMAHVADVIAGAANASAIGVNDFKFSLAASGAVAATVGISFESLSQAIAVMGNAGIKGSDAGTSLKTMLLNLQPTTKAQNKAFRELGIVTADGANKFFDAEGKAKSFAEIAEVLKTALGGMTKQQQLATLEIMFGSDAIRAGAVMLEAGAAGFEQMAEAMGKVTAQQVAEERLNNLWGSIEKLKGSLETAAIILGGQFTPALKRMADSATEFVNQAIDAFEQIPDAIETVRQVIAGDWAPDASIRPFTLAVGNAAVMVRDTFGPAITAVGGILQQLGTWFQANIAPIAAFVAGFLGAVAAAGALSAAIAAVTAVLGFLLSPLELVAIAVGVLAAAWITNFGGIQEKTAAVWAVLQPIFTQIVDWLQVKIGAALTWLAETGWPTFVTAAEAVSTWITGVAVPAFTTLVDWLGPKLQTPLTTLTTTSWPGLQAAMQAAYDVGLLVIKFVQDLWAELEKRGVIDLAKTSFDNLLVVLKPLYDLLLLIVGIAVKVIGFFADLARQGIESGRGVEVVATAIERFFKPIAAGLDSLRQLVEWLGKLKDIQMPSWWGSNPFGGGVPGAQTLSLTTGGGSGDVADYIRMVGKQRGWDDESIGWALRVAQGESGLNPAAVGDSGRSFGPFQLYTGGGMGNAALAAGIDVRDPNTWRQQVEFAMRQAEQQGWTPWTVGRNLGAPRPRMTGSGGAYPMTKTQTGGGDAGNLPPFMNETFEALPAHLQSLETLRDASEQTYTAITTVATEQGRQLVTASTDAMGNVTRIFTENGIAVGATITNAAGQIVNSWGTMATGVTAQSAAMSTGVTEQTNLMASGALTSVTNLGTGILTSVQTTSGTTIATVTDMSGQVTSQYATLANGVTLTMGDMANGVLTSQTALADGMMTIVQDASGNYITTITDMAGNVTNQYVQLAADVTAAATEQTVAVSEQAATMATNVLTSVTDLGDGVLTITTDTSGAVIATITDMAGNVVSEYESMRDDAVASTEDMANTVTETLESIGDISVPAPDTSDLMDAFEDVQDEAKKTREAVKKAFGGSGEVGGKQGAKAAGGPVAAWGSYLVGEQGPELFVPTTSGNIIPNHALASYGGGGMQTLVLDVQIDGRTAERIYVTGQRLAAQRARV